MNSRAFTLSLLIAIFAMFLVNTYIDDQKASITKRYGREKAVVVAKQNIKELELIDDSKVTVMNVPNSFKSPGAFGSIKDVDGTVATVPILKGEQITKPRVTFPGAKTGLSRQVSVGKRAIAMVVNDLRAVGKLIKPGDRVDVIATIDYSDGEKDRQKVMTLFQDVYVLSTGKSLTNSLPVIGVKYPKVIKKMNLSTYADYNTVTLEVTPFQAQKLIYIQQYAGYPLYLSLRNHADKEQVRIQATKLFDVLNDQDSAEAKQFFIQKNNKRTGR
ncbi:MAG: Flp pilus assembly protein CpaB [Bacteriovoracaceae bacterium]